MALATTCPKCNTSFRVAPDQLALRRGMVRCGVCQNVFSGMANLRHVDEILRQRSAAQAAAQAAAQQALPPAPPTMLGSPRTQAITEPPPPPPQGKPFARDERRAEASKAWPAPSAARQRKSSRPSEDDFGHTDLRTAFFLPETVFGPPSRELESRELESREPDSRDPGRREPDEHKAEPKPGPAATMPAAPLASADNHQVSSPGSTSATGRNPDAPDSGVRIGLRQPGPDTRIRWAQEASRLATDSRRSDGIESDSPAEQAHHQSGLAKSEGAQSGLAQTGISQSGTAQSGTAQTGTAQTGITQSGTTQAGTAHSDKLQSGTTQPNKLQNTLHPEGGPSDPIDQQGIAPAGTGLPIAADSGAAATDGAARSEDLQPQPLSEPDSVLASANRKSKSRATDRSDQAIAVFEPDASTIGFATRAVAFGWLLCLLAAVLLVGQLILGARNSIASLVPSLRGPLQGIASTFGLSVEPPMDLQSVTIESFELLGSDTPGQLSLSALFRNRSNRSVQWPAIELMLTDGQGLLLVRKVILPREYFSGLPPATAAKVELGMSPRAELPLKLALEARDLSASGYSVNLFYP